MIKSQLFDTILHVTLSRPERRNALNSELIKELTQIFESTTATAVVLRGEGQTFCAGADLDDMKNSKDQSYGDNLSEAQKLFGLFESIRNCKAVVVSFVHGAIFGGGLGLIAASDMALASPDTTFCFSEVRLGIAPAVISSFVLQKMNPGFARAMMISGRSFDAHQALQSGLVQAIGDEVWLEDTLIQIKKNSPSAMNKTKTLCNHILPVESFKKLTTELIAELRTSDEGQEGFNAFFEKRKPQWQS